MEPFANARVGAGHEKGVADPLTCTPPRKIRCRFRLRTIRCQRALPCKKMSQKCTGLGLDEEESSNGSSRWLKRREAIGRFCGRIRDTPYQAAWRLLRLGGIPYHPAERMAPEEGGCPAEVACPSSGAPPPPRAGRGRVVARLWQESSL